ncbi:hypothetical protein PENFLA_c008G01993 [Penicillium flavigenum]|uniref:Zn(2)-C6 fungal-type domain-containing protein n=1 Tax=Penicillium flavigenum TaxID=254877 RepID=A0A1V6TH93_9EURO|nr:hypothetical protein PENFLA_c008G01993 [Penicillium flavigenum]
MLRRTRRSPTACSWCRQRKVRCDASLLGSPCTRCRQDGRTECNLRAKNPKQYPKSANAVPPTHQGLGSNSVITSRHTNLRQSNDHSTFVPQLRAHGISLDRGISPPLSPNVPYTEYAFIELLSLPSEDVAYLSSNDCLALPGSGALDEFIQVYFRRIHPLVPVLDEAEFWRIYQKNQSTGPKISLLVLQSLLVASCPFVSLETLREECGFNDMRDALKQLYNRANLLFQLRTEKRSHANAQGAVLLTLYTSAQEPQAGSLWLTKAIEYAMLIDTQPSPSVENVAISLSLKKRLWWSILLRDRSLCIGLRRSPQVTSIRLYGWSDWLSIEDFSEELYHSQVYNYNTKKRLLDALQKQCELAVLLTDLVSLAFTHPKTPRRLLSMIEFQGLMSTIKSIKRSLDEWKLPVPLNSPNETSTSDGHDPVTSLTYITYMYYHMARVVLAQHAAYLLEENLFYAGGTYNNLVLEFSNDLWHGIQGLSLVMEHFSINGYADSLPLSVLGYVSMPLVLAAIDLKLSPSREQMEVRQRLLTSLSQIIRHSETLYDVTDCVAVSTNHILQLAYATTQNLFEDKPGQLRSSNNILGRASNISMLPKANRPTSWQDAFIRCPRAYLLISTSFDYAMSTGRLPSASALPEIVRDLARLPWTSEISSSESTSSLARHMNQVQRQSCQASAHSSSVEGREILNDINIEVEPEKNLTPQTVHFNCNSSPDAFSEYPTTPSFMVDEPLQYNRVAKQTDYDNTAPNLDFMDFADFRSVPSNEMETYALGIPLELIDQTFEGENPLEHPSFDTCAATLPQSIKAIDSLLFDTFFHEAFEQNWSVG